MSYNTANKSIPNECVIDIRLPSEWYETGVLEGSHLITFLMASGAVNPLFVHEVTIRLIEDGGYQYTGNQITYRSDMELPSPQARLPLQRFITDDRP